MTDSTRGGILAALMCWLAWGTVIADAQSGEPPPEAGAPATAEPPAASWKIVQTRGVDGRVDYASLVRFGPWDDRNYQLTQEDLALLSPTEEEVLDPIPAFFRVELRKAMPNLMRTGPAQYPHSAVPYFRNKYGGFLIEGKIHTAVRRVEGGFEFDHHQGVTEEIFWAEKVLDGNVRVSSPSSAAESSIMINPVDRDRVIAGSNGPGGGQKMHWSDDGGETWTEVGLPLGSTCCDPTIEWSSDGSLAYSSALCGSICGVWVYRSSDNGESWNDFEAVTPGDPRREIGGGGSDKQFLHVDRSPTSPFQDNVYLCWHVSNIQRFARSTDFGNTWAELTLSSETSGIGCDITTDAAGNVYYFYERFGSQEVRVLKSTDGGVSFDPPVVIDDLNASFAFALPSQETRRVAIIVSADADLSSGPFAGSIYAAWADTIDPASTSAANNHGHIQVARSRDGGATWEISTPHPTDDGDTVDRWQSWIKVAPNGDVHVIFNDTRNSANRTGIDLYHTVSTDGAATWSESQRLSTELSPNLNDGFEFGDYSGMDIVFDRLIAVYTDSRDESGGGGASADIYAAGLGIDSAVFVDGFESGNTTAWSATVP
ncbi:MAG: sialidase family protein [Acidobacteriota bacterium]